MHLITLNTIFVRKQLCPYPHHASDFTSPTTVDLIDALAQADEHELVKTLQEVNAAYFPLNSDALSLQLDTCVAFSREEHTALVQRVRAI